MPDNNWNPANPRLWYRDDLPNHPELIALEGGVIPYKDAALLSKVYSGSVLLTDKVTNIKGNTFINKQVSLSVDVFDGLYPPSHLFGNPLSIDNICKVTEQWLTGDTDVHKMHTVSIELTEPAVITEYWMIAAIGTSTYIDKLHPTPKEWVLLGSDDNENFVSIDEHILDSSIWKPWQISTFKTNTTKAYKYYTLLISEWFSSEILLPTGLKRLWLFGRPENKFILPEIDCPNDSFVWVVPYREKL